MDNYQTYDSAVIYRTIQVLACIANEIQQKVFMSVIVIAATFLISLCTATVVWLPWTIDNLLSILMFLTIGIDCTLAVVTSVGGMAGVYTESVKVIRKLQTSIGIIGGGGYRNLVGRGDGCGSMEVKWKQRFYRSCMSIKIRFASINFVDRLTPLACVDFANDLTLQLLLIGK